MFSDLGCLFSAETDTDALKERQMQIIQRQTRRMTTTTHGSGRGGDQDVPGVHEDRSGQSTTNTTGLHARHGGGGPESGETVFSSYLLRRADFVSPSRMEAESYSGTDGFTVRQSR